MAADARAIAGRFALPGEVIDIAPFTLGHINETHLVTCDVRGGPPRFLLQRLNDRVFCEPAKVMENTGRITSHIARKLTEQGASDVARRGLTLVPTTNGATHLTDEGGGCWRMTRYIEGCRARETVQTPAHAEQAGRAYGTFQRMLIDLEGPRLHETIPGFHDTPRRYEALQRAIAENAAGRAADVRAEIDFALARRAEAGVLIDLLGSGALPERIAHNDAKMSNVLLDERTGEGICVVDLDTVMPGASLYDFGDMVRSMTCRAAEDETDLSTVKIDMALFEGLARGYLRAAGAFLTAAEREQLVFAGMLITLEQGVRFLADYLNGDVYYRTTRPGQNLDRCRAQFSLVQSIETCEHEMQVIMDRLARN